MGCVGHLFVRPPLTMTGWAWDAAPPHASHAPLFEHRSVTLSGSVPCPPVTVQSRGGTSGMKVLFPVSCLLSGPFFHCLSKSVATTGCVQM